MEFTSSEERFWLPVHTRPRCEKKFLLFCKKYNIQAYLPLKIKIRSKGRGYVKSELPMFPGYAFAWLNSQEKTKISQTNSVVNFIPLSKDQEKRLIEDLRSVYILEQLQENEELIVCPEIMEGSEVRIVSGPLRGLAGLVSKRKGSHRVVVNVEMISQSVVMEIDSTDLELELEFIFS